MKSTILAILLVAIVHSGINAQRIDPQVINASGGSYRQGYYSVDWSVGELALVNRMLSSDGSVVFTNGFLQPFTESFLTNIDHQFSRDEIFLFPNPVRDFLEVDIRTRQQGYVTLTLYDAAGKLVLRKETISYGVGLIEKINMSALPGATYTLYILLKPTPGSTGKTGTYKIVKNS